MTSPAEELSLKEKIKYYRDVIAIIANLWTSPKMQRIRDPKKKYYSMTCIYYVIRVIYGDLSTMKIAGPFE